MTDYISKKVLLEKLYAEYADTGYVDDSLESVVELINTIPIIEVDDANSEK